MSRSKKTSPRLARQSVRRLDATLSGTHVPSKPLEGWIRSVRAALGMTQLQLANRLGVTRQNVAALEADEANGNITLARLQRVADALGCELQYALMPRESIEKMIARQAQRRAEQKLLRVNQSQALEASAVAATTLSIAAKDLADELALQRPSDLWDE